MARPPLVKATVAPVLLERVTAGPASGERVLLAPLKVTVPAVLLATLIPVPLLAMVVPRVMVAVLPLISTARVVAPLRAPVFAVSVPATPASLTLLTPLLDESWARVTARVPVVRSRAWPVPVIEASATVRVPNEVPAMALPAAERLPMVSPRTVLFCPRVMAFPAPVTMVGLVPRWPGGDRSRRAR